MGLDSVELLFQIEKKFQIQIQDEESEKISTVADITELIAKTKNIIDAESNLLNAESQKIADILRNIFGAEELKPDDKISLFLNQTTKREWTLLKEQPHYKIPVPSFAKSEAKIFPKIFFWKSNYDWDTLSVKDFIEGILILNSSDIINYLQPTSKSEIYYAAAGVISKHLDINVFEIKPEKRIVEDLGIN